MDKLTLLFRLTSIRGERKADSEEEKQVSTGKKGADKNSDEVREEIRSDDPFEQLSPITRVDSDESMELKIERQAQLNVGGKAKTENKQDPYVVLQQAINKLQKIKDIKRTSAAHPVSINRLQRNAVKALGEAQALNEVQWLLQNAAVWKADFRELGQTAKSRMKQLADSVAP